MVAQAAASKKSMPEQDLPRHPFGIDPAAPGGVQGRAQHAGVHGGADAVPHHVAHREGEPPVHRLRQVEVAAESVAGEEPAVDPPARAGDRLPRQQAVLEETCLLEVAGERLGIALLGDPLALQTQAALDQGQQHPAVERLEEEVEGPLLQRAEELLVRLGDRAGDQDHVGLAAGGRGSPGRACSRRRPSGARRAGRDRTPRRSSRARASVAPATHSTR